jgi:hypothetical protein
MNASLSCRRTRRRWPALVLLLLLASNVESSAQRRSAFTTTDDLRDIRPFQAWITDATFTEGVDVEPVAELGSGDGYARQFYGANAAFYVARSLEMGARFGLSRLDPDGLDVRTGASDLRLYGRYRIDMRNEALDFGAGAWFDVPLGKEEVGGETFDFSGFAAVRYRLSSGVGLLASGGLLSVEERSGRDTGIFLGGGSIFPITEELALIAEFNFNTTSNFTAITGGVDYELPPGGHLRGALSLGLEDGADDVRLFFGFVIPVY